MAEQLYSSLSDGRKALEKINKIKYELSHIPMGKAGLTIDSALITINAITGIVYDAGAIMLKLPKEIDYGSRNAELTGRDETSARKL